MTLEATAREGVSAYSLGYEENATGGRFLPPKIALFTPIATSKQGGFTAYNVPKVCTSVKEFLDTYGSCPGLFAMRILKPVQGGGVGTVPVYVFPIEDASAATAAVGDITPSGTADSTAIHYVVFNGRKYIDGYTCSYLVEKNDAPAAIIAKQIAAINGFKYSPVVASDGTTKTTLTSTWKGVTGDEIEVTIDTGTDGCGIAYGVNNPTGASGAGEITDALGNFGVTWYTHIVHPYGTTLNSTFATANGIPDPDTGGTGRWNCKVKMPFIAYAGVKLATKANIKALVTSDITDMTNALCPGYGTQGQTIEISSNIAGMSAVNYNTTPQSDIVDMPFWDLPAPATNTIGELNDYDVRNDLLVNGCSTVTYTSEEGYILRTLIVPRRPADQPGTSIDWSYVHSIYQDMQVMYNYELYNNLYLKNKTIIIDAEYVDDNVTNTIKPKDWKAKVFDLIDDLQRLAIIVDAAYSKKTVTVSINSTDSQRIDTRFHYKRSGIARKTSAVAYTGYFYG